MAFIPYNQFVIDTPLPAEMVMEKLSQVVQPKRFWPNPFSEDRKQFEGIVSKGCFRMVRNIYYLNSFIPLIKGRFASSDSGTRIIITMATHPFVILTFGLVFAFFGYFLFTYLMELLSGIFVTIGCLALAYTICTLAFKRESALDRRFLVELFSEQDKAS
jgi:hypothetical protein